MLLELWCTGSIKAPLGPVKCFGCFLPKLSMTKHYQVMSMVKFCPGAINFDYDIFLLITIFGGHPVEIPNGKISKMQQGLKVEFWIWIDGRSWSSLEGRLAPSTLWDVHCAFSDNLAITINTITIKTITIQTSSTPLPSSKPSAPTQQCKMCIGW